MRILVCWILLVIRKGLTDSVFITIGVGRLDFFMKPIRAGGTLLLPMGM